MKCLVFFLLISSTNAGAQHPPGEQRTGWMPLKCAGFPDSIQAPSVMGYERLTSECLDNERAILHYASSHASTVDAMLNANGNAPRLIGVLVYAPCQSCNPPTTTVYRLKCDKPLSAFFGQDMLLYTEEHGQRTTSPGTPSYGRIRSRFITRIEK